METRQHSRPLWVGLVACTFFVPSLMAVLQMFSVDSVIIGPIFVFIVGSAISGLVTVFAAAPIVLLLRHFGWLNAIVLCIFGTAVGAAALGWLTISDNQNSQMNDQTFAQWIAQQAAFKVMVPGAIYGFLSAVALCVGAGITIRSSRARFAASFLR